MEQVAQKRSSKDKGNDKVKIPEDEPSIVEVARSVTELQSQMEAVNSRLDAQERAQKELSERLAHVEDNISAIKMNVENISSAMGELFRQLVNTRIVREPVSNKIQPMQSQRSSKMVMALRISIKPMRMQLGKMLRRLAVLKPKLLWSSRTGNKGGNQRSVQRQMVFAPQQKH